MGTLYNLHRATNFIGERGSVLLSTKSEMEKVVPSTSLTMAVSLLDPESSTKWFRWLRINKKLKSEKLFKRRSRPKQEVDVPTRIDFAESFRMMSNSEEVTDGTVAALDADGSRSKREEVAMLERSARRATTPAWCSPKDDEDARN